MASVRRVKYGQFVVSWPDTNGNLTAALFDRRRDARAAAQLHPHAMIVQEQGEGPVRYEVHYRDANGRQHGKRFRLKAEADRFAVQAETARTRGTVLDPRAGQITFRDYAEQWLATRRLAATTRERTALGLRVHVYPALGHLRLSQIKPEEIQAWLSTLGGSAESTRSVVFANVSAMLASAVDNGRITRNPCTAPSLRTSKPRPTRSKTTPWTDEQVAAVFAHLPERYAVFVILGVGLGLRQGEAFALSPTDIDWTRNVVHVHRQVVIVSTKLQFALPKGSKTREVPMAPTVGAHIARHLERFPAKSVTLPWSDEQHRSSIRHGSPVRTPLILTTREKKALNRYYFNPYVWKSACIKAGIDPVRSNGTHALRHHYASTLLDAGESIVALSQYLGHHDPAFTLRTYTHVLETSSQRTRAALDTSLSWLLEPGEP